MGRNSWDDDLKRDNWKRLFSIFSLAIVVMLVFMVGNSFDSSYSITGNAARGVSPVSYLTGLVVDSYDEELVKRFDKDIDLEVKKPVKFGGEVVSRNKNERMEFIGSDDWDNFRLYFDLLNYSEFVSGANSVLVEKGLVEGVQTGYGEDVESQTGYGSEENFGITGNVMKFFGITGNVIRDFEINNFSELKDNIGNLSSGEIEVISDESVVELEDSEFEVIVNESLAEESGVDYKWGYNVELKDLNFMAKIDVTSDEVINVLDNSSLKMGDKLLSFSDLVDEGYSVRIEMPVLEIGVNDSNITVPIVINESDEFTDGNLSDKNVTDEIISNETVVDVNVTIGNVTDEIIVNETETEVEINVSLGNETDLDSDKKEKKEKKDEKDKNDEKKKNDKVDEEEVVDDVEVIEEGDGDVEDGQTGYGFESDGGITGGVIKWLTGFVVNSVTVEVSDIEYENKITVYIERDFTKSNYSVGDVVYLDPTLVIENFTGGEILSNVTQENNFTHLTVSEVAPYDSLVLYMPFDVENKSDGIVYDWTKENNDGTINGDPIWNSSGKYGGAYEFDVVGDVITKSGAALPNITDNGTICMWIKINEYPASANAGQRGNLFEAWRGGSDVWFFGITTIGELYMGQYSSDNVVAGGVSLNEWTFACGTWNQSDFGIYQNAVFQGSDGTGGIPYDCYDYRIGLPFNAEPGFNGSIDEVMIFNTSLTAQQITDIYNNQSARFKTPGTQSLKQFNITTGNNTVNVTTADFQENFSSSLDLRVGEWDVTLGYNDSVDGDSATVNIDDGLVGYWHLDNQSDIGENDTHSYDWSGNGNNGSVYNGTVMNMVDGVYAGYGGFDGIDDYIDFGSGSSLDNLAQGNFTLSTWIYPESYGGPTDGRILVKRSGNDGWAFRLESDGGNNLRFATIRGDASSDVIFLSANDTIVLNKWQHVVLVFSNDTLNGSFYIDGIEPSYASHYNGSTGSADDSSGTLKMGVNQNANNRFFNGSIDEVMIYNRSLTLDEIQELYIKGKAKFNYLTYQDVVSGSDNIFGIGTASTNILPEYRLNAGNSTNPFYSPIFGASGGSPISIEYGLDSIPPDINFTRPTPFSGDLVYGTNLLVNVSFSGDNATVYLFNSSKGLINSTSSVTSPLFVNFSGLDSGVYYFNATSADLVSSNSTDTWNVVVLNDSAEGDGSVSSMYKINESRFGNGAELGTNDYFGWSVANIGDLNNDGVQDIAVGAQYGTFFWILFLNTTGGIIDEYKINASRFGNGSEYLTYGFGASLANIGDLNNDGVQDLVVGEYTNDDGGDSNGAVWIMFLNTSGGIIDEYKINESRFGNGNELETDAFGYSVANIGDLNNDGVQDIAVGGIYADGGANGAVWIMFLNTSGGVIDEYKINGSRFGNGNELDNAFFGNSLANIGDLNNDGVQDLVVGEYTNDDGGGGTGVVWIMFLNTSGGVIDEYKINESRFGNGNELGLDWFGASVANIGDLNNDGVQDIAVGELYGEDVWILFLNTSGGVINEYKINSSLFLNGKGFGVSVANLGDLNNDGVQDLVVGEYANNDGGSGNGVVWILSLSIDDNGPEIGIVVPANNTNSSNAGLDVNYTASDVNVVDSCWYSNDTMSSNVSLGTSCDNITTVVWVDGSHNVTIWANDSLNNVGSASVVFTISTDSPPNVTINYPGNSTYGSSINFNVTVVDDNLIDSCWYSLDSGVSNVTMINSTVNDDYNHTNSSIGDGGYLMNVYCNDSNGNVNGSESLSFGVDGTIVEDCITLDVAGMTYTQNANIVQDEASDCIIVQAANVTLDCAGFSITSIQNTSGVYSDQFNTTVKNCNISMGSDGNSSAMGIELTDAADNSTVINNTIVGEMGYGIGAISNGPEYSLIEGNYINVSAINSTGGGVSTDGIYLRNSDNNILANNTFISLAGRGIYFYGSSTNTFRNNTGISDSNYGIYLYAGSNANLLINNTGISTSSIGIVVQKYGGALTYHNILINNTGTSNSSYGIWLGSVINTTLTSNTGSSNSGSGIYFSSAANYNYLNSNIATSVSGHGIFFHSCSYNNLTSNIATSVSGSGIYIYSDSDNNIFINDTGMSNSSYGVAFVTYSTYPDSNTLINVSGISNFSYGVYFGRAINQNITNLRAEGRLAGSYGLYLRDSSNNIFRDCVNVSGVAGDVFVNSDTSPGTHNNSFINCSYSSESVNGAGNDITRKWYYRAYVNDSSGNALSGVNVSGYNSSDVLQFSEMTNSSGYTNRTEIIDYVNVGGTKIYYSNYTINSSADGYILGEHSYNVTLNENNLEDNFEIKQIQVWNCTSGTNSFDTPGCWVSGNVPSSGDGIIFNGSGVGNVNITNNTMPQDLDSFLVDSGYTGTIYFGPLFAVGDWTGNNDGTQLWNVTNDINISNGTMKVYGDYLHESDGTGNITNDGHGQEWRSVSGDVILGSEGVIDGVGLGFPRDVGPGDEANDGAPHGGRGSGVVNPYGNATAPTSLGSGGESGFGGSGIKLHSSDILDLQGIINMSGIGSSYSGSGGSIWLKANNITGTGNISASGVKGVSYPSGGGRIRLEYSSSMDYGGIINISGNYPGTLTFTNNTWPSNWNVSGEFALLGGDYGEPGLRTNTTNVLGDFNVLNGMILYVYGDCYTISATPVDYACYNKTSDGRGVWINVSGNITLEEGGIISGYNLGFHASGPGYGVNDGGTYGGKGMSSLTNPYGNATAPVSLGSGSASSGGSAIKLETTGIIDASGIINISGGYASYYASSGGSIWLKANNITGTGNLVAKGGSAGTTTYDGGGGGRIRLEYGNSMSYSGLINLEGGKNPSLSFNPLALGTLTFTNNTWPNNWNVNGSFGLLGGNYGEGNVTNVLGDFNVLNGSELSVYGDCFGNSGSYLAYVCYNVTDDGRGVWINSSGDISVDIGGEISGVDLGFPNDFGPGFTGAKGTYGSGTLSYGSAIAPVSLGSGSDDSYGSSAVKLESPGIIDIQGIINVSEYSGNYDQGAGGSIWLYSDNITVGGILDASGADGSYQGGGGGRISLESSGIISVGGTIFNDGGIESDNPVVGSAYGSAGSVWINATTSITSSGNISAVGYNGSDADLNISSGYLSLSGVYNATSRNSSIAENGTILVTYTNCSSVLNGTFEPDYSYSTSCPLIGSNVLGCTSLSTAGTTYTVVNDISNDTLTTDCMIISAANVTLDCSGYDILSEDNFTGVYSDQFNTTVKNCNISIGSLGDSGAIGIELTDAADNSTIDNNTIIGGMIDGISLKSEDSVVSNNSVNVSIIDVASDGIQLNGAMRNNVINNTAISLAGYGIHVNDGNYNNLTSNTAISNSSHAIYVRSQNNRLINNSGVSNSGSGYYSHGETNNGYFEGNLFNSTSSAGCVLGGEDFATMINNTFISNSSTGFNLGGGANSNNITNNTMLSNNYALSVGETRDNVILNSRIEGGVYGIYMRESQNNTFRDCVNLSGGTNDVYIHSDTSPQSLNNTILNCSYDSESVNGVGNYLIRKWYYQAYVNDSLGNSISGVNVSGYNSSDVLQFSEMTNSSGYTNRTEIIDYVNVGGTKIYYSNYTINSSKGAFTTLSESYNVTANENNLDYNFNFNEVELTCDSGDVTSTCNISTSYSNLGDGVIYVANNVNILSGGILANTTSNCTSSRNTTGANHGCSFSLKLNGNLTVMSGGNITVGNVSITAENVDVQSGGLISTNGLGWDQYSGPGTYAALSPGSEHGAGPKVYGSMTEPITMGSGGYTVSGGGIIFINATGDLNISGSVTSLGEGRRDYASGSGGSIWLISGSDLYISNNISVKGGDSGSGYPWRSGSGGRIALYGATITQNGNIYADLGAIDNGYVPTGGYGGTVYINATNSVTSNSNISVRSYNGTGSKVNLTSSYLNLTGIYNVTAINQSVSGTVNGTTTLTYTNCSSVLTLGTFDPSYSYSTSCPLVGTDVLGCTSLSTAGTTYTVVNDISNDTLTGDCLIVSAANVTLDCSGYLISSEDNFTGVYSNQFNTTIKNCNISMGSENVQAKGIELLDGADNSTLLNNSFYGAMNYGIWFGAEDSLIANNSANITSTTVVASGIYFSGAYNNTVRGNTMHAYRGAGIYITSSSSYNLIINNSASSTIDYGVYFLVSNNNLINNTIESDSDYSLYLNSADNNNITGNIVSSNSNYGIRLFSGSDNNVFTKNIISSGSNAGVSFSNANNNLFRWTNTSGTYGFLLQDASNNTFKDCVFVNGTTNDVTVNSDVSPGTHNNSFINCSYDSESVNGVGNDITRKWYYSAYVNDSSGVAVSGANVSAYNSSGGLEFLEVTNGPLEVASSDSLFNGLVGYWKMNNDSSVGENDTHVYDHSGSGNNGSVTSAVVSSNGKINGGFSFDGSGDDIDIPELVSNVSGTFTAWFKSNSSAAQYIIGSSYSSNDRYYFYLDGGELNGRLGNGGAVTVSGDYSDNEWYFASLNWSDGVFTLCVNGDSSCNAGSYTTLNEPVSLFIGRSTAGVYFNGLMDEVMVYNRSLSASEITELFEKGRGGKINRTTLTEYVNVGGTKTYYSLYTINATNGSSTSLHSYNVSLEENNLSDRFTLDYLNPGISIANPANNTNSTDVNLDVNYTMSDNLGVDSCWYSNDTMVANTSLGTGGSCLNITSVIWVEGYHNVSIWVNDTSGNENKSSVSFLVDATAPNVTMHTTGMPTNDSVGGSSVLFNWSVVDNLDSNLSCYALQGGTKQTLRMVANSSNVSYTETLSGGQYDLRVTCYDDSNNSANSSDRITYLVAVINMSLPVNNLSYRFGDSVTLFNEELDGTNFLTMSSFRIKNQSGSVVNLTNGSEVQTNNWSLSYAIPDLDPQFMTVSVSSWNVSVGESQNVSETKGIILLRAEGNTTAPLMNRMCPNSTYIANGSEIEIRMRGNLDTLVQTYGVNVSSPDGTIYNLTEDSSLQLANYVYSRNYSLVVNQTGTYNVTGWFKDYENQTVNRNYSFYSVTGFKRYRINSSLVTNFTVQDRCGGDQHGKGKDITVVVPTGGLLDLNVSVNDTLHDLRLLFRDINLTSNLTNAIGYNELSNETTTPTDERRIALFELNNSNLSYVNYTFVYDYTAISHTINNESSLKLWKCDDISNCSLSEQTVVVNITSNTVSAVLENMSFFMVTEDGTSTETVTETVSSGGGGGSTKTVYKSLNILVPGQIEMSLNDEVVVPINLINPEASQILKDISLNASPNTKDLSAQFDKPEIDQIDGGKNETVMLFLQSHSDPGEYDVDIIANVSDPRFNSEAKLFVKLVEVVGRETILERVLLAQDLFREHPECLELNDYLIEAERLLEEEDVEGAKVLVQKVVISCKDLVAGKSVGFFSLEDANRWESPVLWVLGLVVLVLVIVLIIRKPKLNLYKSKNDKENKRWFKGFGKKSKKKSKVVENNDVFEDY
jgi:parallel beta-helix repeat protein